MSTWRPLRLPRSEQEPRLIGDPLERVARRYGVPSHQTSKALTLLWEEVVGPGIAAHARAGRLRGGVLSVEVDDPAWATQLQFMSADLLARIQAAAGSSEVTEIRVRMAGQRPPRKR